MQITSNGSRSYLVQLGRGEHRAWGARWRFRRSRQGLVPGFSRLGALQQGFAESLPGLRNRAAPPVGDPVARRADELAAGRRGRRLIRLHQVRDDKRPRLLVPDRGHVLDTGAYSPIGVNGDGFTGDSPVDQFTLNFAKLEIVYTSQVDGSTADLAASVGGVG